MSLVACLGVWKKLKYESKLSGGSLQAPSMFHAMRRHSTSSGGVKIGRDIFVSAIVCRLMSARSHFAIFLRQFSCLK